MSSLKLVLTSPVAGAGGYVGDDAILTPGSLILHDLTHSQNPLASGVPASGTAIPNIAYAECAAVLGSGTQSSLVSTFTNNALSADAIFERTAKGGLHGLYSHVNNTNANRGAYIRAAAAIEAYLYANLTHDLYFSIWTYRTRVAITTAQNPRMVAAPVSINSAGNFKIILDATSAVNNALTGKLSALSNGPNSAGLSRRSVESSAWSNGNPASAADTAAYLMGWGNWGPGTAAWENITPGDIFYRCYLEDLTVSGRTASVVDTLEASLFTQRVLTAGGAYYGDSGWTAPSSFP